MNIRINAAVKSSNSVRHSIKSNIASGNVTSAPTIILQSCQSNYFSDLLRKINSMNETEVVS